MTAKPRIQVRRVYEKASPGEGYRVLVDRLWPRGIRRDALEMDEWCKDVAPSTELRRWYGHRPELFDEFAERYRAELDASGAATQLLARAGDGGITLLTAVHDVEISQAAVLKGYLLDHTP